VLIFSESFFFVVLLPPIIFESGFAMRRGFFFRNIGVTSMLAWAGTAFSALLTAVGLYLAGIKGWCYPITFVEAMIFGSLISATDPVSVLAVFSKLGVNRDLNAIVFGESILNDAVAIVLVRAVEPFLEEVQFKMADVWSAVLMFVIVFAGSVIMGSVVALVTALLLKHTHLRSHLALEMAVVILQGYICYFFAEGIHLSGIVAMLFNGIVVAHYGGPNLSKDGLRACKQMFRVCAEMAETFIFVYLGLVIFSIVHEYDVGLIVLTLILILVARALHVTLFVSMTNVTRSKVTTMALIPQSHAIIIWFAGLRGGIAFALALSLHTKNSDVLLSTTLVIVLITVLAFGVGTEPLLEKLKIDVGHGADEEEDANALKEERKGFLAIDAKVFMPFFTHAKRPSANPADHADAQDQKKGAQGANDEASSELSSVRLAADSD
jgi:sodium/hydrogen exchanger 3